MELLFYIFIISIVIFLNLGLFISPLLTVTEEDIRKNLSKLKKYKWFQDLLDDKNYKYLIVHDKDVRKVIGKLNNKKLDNAYFNNIYRKRIKMILRKKSNFA